MILNLTIPDNLYQHYYDRFGKTSLYRKMKEAIEFMKDVEPNDRYFLVTGEDRRRIETVMDHTIESASVLAKDVEKLNRFRIGDIGITFNAEELARIDVQAQFHSKDRETYMKEMAEYIKNRMLENV